MKTDDAECEWCPVKLDTSGVYIAPGEWGCCNDACPKTIDKGNNTNTKILLLLPGVPFQEFKMSKLLILGEILYLRNKIENYLRIVYI